MKVVKTLIFSAMFLLLGCQPTITGVAGFEPSGIPVKITVDTSGKIGFEFQTEVKYPTLLGTFSAGVVVDPVSYFNKASTLTIRIDCEDTFYDLHGQDFSIDFQSGYYEGNLTKRGNNLFLELQRMGSSDSANCIPLADSSAISGIFMATKDAQKNTFSPTDTIYVYFDVNDVEKGSQFVIKWYPLGVEEYGPDNPFIVQTYTYDHAKSINANIFPKGDQTFPLGQYMVEIDLNGVKIGEQQFSVK